MTYGGLGDDYAEGNPGTDRTWGEDGDDDIVGGSSQLASGTEAGRPDTNDYLYGGSGQDVIAGDNATITRGGVGHPLMTGRGLRVTRGVDLADEGAGDPSGVSGDDTIESGDDTDLVFGQRGADTVSLGGDADYGEGGPGVDRVHGDAGDDDVVGGSYTPAVDNAVKPTGQPDGADVLFGDAGQDVVLGDNGAVTRPASTGLSTSFVAPVTASRLTTNRVTAAHSITPYDLGDTPLAAASGSDTITGDADNDVLLGQGGNDRRRRRHRGTTTPRVGRTPTSCSATTATTTLAGGSSATVADNAGGPAGQPDASDNVVGGSWLRPRSSGDNGLLTRGHVRAGLADEPCRRDPGCTGPGTRDRPVRPQPVDAARRRRRTHAATDSLSGQAGRRRAARPGRQRPHQRRRRRRLRRG